MSTFSKRTLPVAFVAIVLTIVFYRLGSYPRLKTAFAPDCPFDEAPARSLQEVEDRLERAAKKADQSPASIRDLYRSHLLRDIPFFLANAVVCAALLLLASGPERPRGIMAMAIALPLAAVVADGAENGALAIWFYGPGPTEPSVRVAYLATGVKFAVFIVMAVIFVATLLTRALHRHNA